MPILNARELPSRLSKGVLVSTTHKKAHFHTIQSAIDHLLHDDTSQTVLILSGTYTEQLNVT